MNYINEAIIAQNQLESINHTRNAMNISGSSMSQVTGGLRMLGIISDSQTKSLRKITGAISTINGTLSLMVAYHTFLNIYRMRQVATASVETGVHATVQNWTGIALATATALSVSTVIIAANALSDPVKRGDVMSSLRGILHG